MHKLAVVLTLVFAACGGGASLSLEEYPQEVRDAFCQNFVKCGVIKDLETCRKLDFGVDIQLTETFLAAVDSGKAKFNGDKAKSCVDGIADASCDVFDDTQRAGPVECSQILTGTLRAGGACTVSAECISLDCRIQDCNMACCPGTCLGDTAPVVAKLGEACQRQTTRCETGSYCDSDSGTCLAVKPLNAECTSQDACDSGLACVGTVTSGNCVKPPKLGETCTSFCSDFDAVCDPTSKLCVKVVLGGEACVINAGGSNCSPLYFCDGGRCSGGTPLGATCAADNECADFRAFCDIPDNSDTGTCALPKANGGTCLFDTDCQSLACDPSTFVCVDETVCM